MSDITPNQARGYKAALHNPNVSEQAKQHAANVVDEDTEREYVEVEQERQQEEEDKDPVNVARGLKASLHNPNVSEEKKDDAAQKLEEMGAAE